MLDTVIEFWRNLPIFIKFPLDFFLTVIVMRGIVANEISNWLKEKGIMKDGILHAIAKTGKKLIPTDSRASAIFTHYKTGHGTNSVATCNHGDCQIFA